MIRPHRFQNFPDFNNEYWFETDYGVWKVKPKKGWNMAVMFLLMANFNVHINRIKL